MYVRMYIVYIYIYILFLVGVPLVGNDHCHEHVYKIPIFTKKGKLAIMNIYTYTF